MVDSPFTWFPRDLVGRDLLLQIFADPKVFTGTHAALGVCPSQCQEKVHLCVYADFLYIHICVYGHMDVTMPPPDLHYVQDILTLHPTLRQRIATPEQTNRRKVQGEWTPK